MAYILAIELDMAAYADRSQAKQIIRDHPILYPLLNYKNFKLQQVSKSSYMSGAEHRKVWGWYGLLPNYSHHKLNRIGNNIVYITQDTASGSIAYGPSDWPALYPETQRRKHRLEQSEINAERKKRENAERRKEENARKRKLALSLEAAVTEENLVEKSKKRKIPKKVKEEKEKKTSKKGKEKKERKRKEKTVSEPLIKKEEQDIDSQLQSVVSLPTEEDRGSWSYNVTASTGNLSCSGGDFSSRVD